MASVHIRKESKFWRGTFWHEGKQVYHSAGQTEQAKALQVVLAWQEAVKGPVETQEQARKVMEDLLQKVLGQSPGPDVVWRLSDPLARCDGGHRGAKDSGLLQKRGRLFYRPFQLPHYLI